MAKQTVTVGNAIIALAGNDDPFNEQVHPQLPLRPTKKQLGERSQAHITAAMLEVGYNVLLPYGDSSRYDLVIEDADGKFWKVQCKTAWMEDEGASIQFAATSLRSRSSNGKVTYSRAGYVGQVDYFAVYSHELLKVYLIPAGHIGDATRMRLRLTASKNNQQKGIKWAKDYEI